MSAEAEDGMTTREVIEANLSGPLCESLCQLIGAKRDAGLFRDRLVTILCRHERLLVTIRNTPKKELRTTITALSNHAERFVQAIKALPPDVTRELDCSLNAVTEEDRWEGWAFESDEQVPADDTSLKDAQVAAQKILAACRLQMNILDETKGEKRSSADPSLDQLIHDLAGLFEAETGRLGETQCYREDAKEEGYNGSFFHMTKCLLDEFAPHRYATPAALGIRILRVLKNR